jgi:hypothetical protein
VVASFKTDLTSMATLGYERITPETRTNCRRPAADSIFGLSGQTGE